MDSIRNFFWGSTPSSSEKPPQVGKGPQLPQPQPINSGASTVGNRKVTNLQSTPLLEFILEENKSKEFGPDGVLSYSCPREEGSTILFLNTTPTSQYPVGAPADQPLSKFEIEKYHIQAQCENILKAVPAGAKNITVAIPMHNKKVGGAAAFAKVVIDYFTDPIQLERLQTQEITIELHGQKGEAGLAWSVAIEEIDDPEVRKHFKVADEFSDIPDITKSNAHYIVCPLKGGGWELTMGKINQSAPVAKAIINTFINGKSFAAGNAAAAASAAEITFPVASDPQIHSESASLKSGRSKEASQIVYTPQLVKQIVITLIEQGFIGFRNYSNLGLSNDLDVYKTVLKHSSSEFEFNLAMAALQQDVRHPRVISSIGKLYDSVKYYPLFAKAVLTRDGTLLSDFPEKIKDSPEFVKVAMKQNIGALQFATLRCRNDPEIQRYKLELEIENKKPKFGEEIGKSSLKIEPSLTPKQWTAILFDNFKTHGRHHEGWDEAQYLELYNELNTGNPKMMDAIQQYTIDGDITIAADQSIYELFAILGALHGHQFDSVYDCYASKLEPMISKENYPSILQMAVTLHDDRLLALAVRFDNRFLKAIVRDDRTPAALYGSGGGENFDYLIDRTSCGIPREEKELPPLALFDNDTRQPVEMGADILIDAIATDSIDSDMGGKIKAHSLVLSKAMQGDLKQFGNYSVSDVKNFLSLVYTHGIVEPSPLSGEIVTADDLSRLTRMGERFQLKPELLEIISKAHAAKVLSEQAAEMKND